MLGWVVLGLVDVLELGGVEGGAGNEKAVFPVATDAAGVESNETVYHTSGVGAFSDDVPSVNEVVAGGVEVDGFE